VRSRRAPRTAIRIQRQNIIPVFVSSSSLRRTRMGKIFHNTRPFCEVLGRNPTMDRVISTAQVASRHRSDVDCHDLTADNIRLTPLQTTQISEYLPILCPDRQCRSLGRTPHQLDYNNCSEAKSAQAVTNTPAAELGQDAASIEHPQASNQWLKVLLVLNLPIRKHAAAYGFHSLLCCLVDPFYLRGDQSLEMPAAIRC